MLDNQDRGREIERVAMKRFSQVIGFVALVVFGACSLAADGDCTNTIPAVVWTSRSGFGPFQEIRSESYESAGWLKWLLEPHRLRCDIRLERGVPYVLGVSVPNNMQLTHVSYHPEWANRLSKDDHDFGWCKVSRAVGWAEITIPACRRSISLCLAFRESGWPFFRVSSEDSRSILVCDLAASQYDREQKVYKELSDRPCATPLSAARAAERIFVAQYGDEVLSERPWRVTETNGCYLVTGSLPKDSLGGVAQLRMQKDDGRVWVYYHGE